MGRGRGKGKKQSAIAARDDAGSGEEEKIPTYKRRGRPNKPLKDEFEEVEEAEKIEDEEEDGGNTKSTISSKDLKNQNGTENGRKRKKSSKVRDSADFVKEENDVAIKNGVVDSIKPVGFRQNGSRRKNTPRRAAEVGVGCE